MVILGGFVDGDAIAGNVKNPERAHVNHARDTGLEATAENLVGGDDIGLQKLLPLAGRYGTRSKVKDDVTAP